MRRREHIRRIEALEEHVKRLSGSGHPSNYELNQRISAIGNNAAGDRVALLDLIERVEKLEPKAPAKKAAPAKRAAKPRAR